MGGKTSQSTQTVSIPPEVLARYNAVNARAEKVADTPFQQYSTDPNAFVAPLNQTQQGAIANTNAAAGAAQPYYGAATGLTLAGAQNANLGPLNTQQYMNPFTNAVADTTYQALRQQQQQEMMGQTANAIRSGAFGGDRSGLAAANLARQQQLGTAQALSPIFQQGYSQALQTAQQQQGAQLGAQQQNLARYTQAGQQLAGLGAGAQSAALSGAQAQLAAGQTQQQTEQAGKTALYNQFLQQQGYPFQVAQFLANIAEGTGALSGSTTTSTQPAPFFSDRRLKHDVKEIGETFDGQPIYKYKYNGDDRTQIGLMAQDVEKRHPDAVGLAAGYRTVDYDKATEDAADRGKFYSGGLVAEGGAVDPSHAGLGFAMGGSAGFDQDLVAQILKNQQGMYSGIYGQAGSPLGASGTPGLAGRVPAANLPVGKLAVASGAPQQSASGLSQAASTGKNISELLQMGSKVKPYITGGKDAEGTRIPSIQERMIAATGESQNMNMPSAAAPAAAGVAPQKVAEAQMELGGGKIDFADLGDSVSAGDLFDVAARGGRIKKAVGGEADDDAPENLYNPIGPGIGIPDERNKNELKTAGPMPKQQDSGVGDVIGIAAKILPFFLKDGGVVPGKAFGGSRDAAPAEEDAGLVPSQFGSSVKRVLEFEGKLNPRDTNGAPSMYGINAKANPDIDLSTLTPEKATQLYRDRYWKPLEADKMPPALAHVAFDTSVIAGPKKAKELIEQSGGDPNKLLALRSDFQNQLIQANPEKYGPYKKSWDNRISTLASDVASMTGEEPYRPQMMQRNAIAEGASAPVPGVAGNARGATDAYNAPFLNLAQRATGNKVPGELQSENFWIPALAGVGSMLASRSPYLGNALGEGLVGGTSAYTSLAKQQADIGKTKAETEGTMANVVNSSIKSEGGRTYIRAVGPNGYYWMPFNEWWALDPTKRPKVDPRIEQIIPTLAPVLAKEESAAAPAGGLSPQKPSPIVERQELPAIPGAQPEPSVKPATSTPAVSPAPATSQTQKVAAFELNPEEQARALALVRNKSGWSEDRLKQEPDYFTPQDALARTAAEQKQIVLPLAGALAALPEKGSIYTSGKFQEIANPVVSVLNNLAAVAGVPNLISDPKQLANQEEVKKLARQLQGVSTPEGQHAYAAFRDTMEALPTIMNSPGGQAKLVAQLLTNGQRITDKNDYFTKWNDAASGPDKRFSEWARSTSREANRSFDEKYNNSFYAKERDNLEKMFKQKVAGPDGKPVSLLAYLSTNSADLNEKQKSELRQRYGDGILRYFGTK